MKAGATAKIFSSSSKVTMCGVRAGLCFRKSTSRKGFREIRGVRRSPLEDVSAPPPGLRSMESTSPMRYSVRQRRTLLQLAFKSSSWVNRAWTCLRASIGFCLGSHGKRQDVSPRRCWSVLRIPALPNRSFRPGESCAHGCLSPDADRMQWHGHAAIGSHPGRSPATNILQRDGWRSAHEQFGADRNCSPPDRCLSETIPV
jgi:hypothetical protein